MKLHKKSNTRLQIKTSAGDYTADLFLSPQTFIHIHEKDSKVKQCPVISQSSLVTVKCNLESRPASEGDVMLSTLILTNIKLLWSHGTISSCFKRMIYNKALGVNEDFCRLWLLQHVKKQQRKKHSETR